MANIVRRQILEDGPRNTIIKIAGILDTSDIAATGEIGASGFTTTAGSRNVAFVAGALVPTVGQYVTFSDTAATFVAGTYITAVTDATHIVVSTAALKDNAAAAVAITGTAGAIVILDPAFLEQIGAREGLANRLAVVEIEYTVEAALAVYLYFEATANALIAPLQGWGELEPCVPINNIEATGVTGKIVLSTQGQAGTLSFTVLLCVKKYQK